MIWRLLNLFLGFDYIYWSNSADQGIARVFRLPDGGVYYWRYRITSVMDEIKSPEQVRWITCKPSKYFREIV